MFTGKQVNFDSKMPYYSKRIQNLQGNQKILFAAVDKPIQRKLLPSSESHEKLTNTRACLNRENSTQSSHSIDERLRANSVFSEFKVVTGDQLMKLIGKISKNSCDLDPITVLRYPQDAFKDLFYH